MSKDTNIINVVLGHKDKKFIEYFLYEYAYDSIFDTVASDDGIHFIGDALIDKESLKDLIDVLLTVNDNFKFTYVDTNNYKIEGIENKDNITKHFIFNKDSFIDNADLVNFVEVLEYNKHGKTIEDFIKDDAEYVFNYDL